VAPESSSLGELREYKVVGVYDSGLKHYDNRIGIMALNDSQEFFKMKKRVHGLEIGLKKPQDSKTIAQKNESQILSHHQRVAIFQ
jgi:lipoprotein-releasing system permease protein